MARIWRSPSTGWGVALLAIGLALPSFLEQHHFGVFKAIVKAIDSEDSGWLLTAALRLVTLNTLRAIPIYFGAFLIGEAALQGGGTAERRLWGYILPVGAIPLLYWGIQLAYGIQYDLGVPALLVTVSMVILHRISFRTHSRRNRGAILLLLLHAVQWLDVAPLLTDVGFGRGELSMTIKQAALFAGTAEVLNTWSLALAIFLTTIAVVTAKFMVDANKHVALLEQARRQEVAMERARVEQLEARTDRETQTLVHDLKTPLTTIVGLASLLKMVAKEAAIQRHAAAIENAAGRMSAMVSEILYSGPSQVLTLGELMEFVRAQMPGQRDYVKFHIEDGEARVQINRIRLARALVNIIRNGIESGTTQPVAVKTSLSGGEVQIEIADCGQGIPSHDLAGIWKLGYSTKGGSGLGLPFARTVIETDHGGRVQVESVVERGTTFRVFLPIKEGSRVCETESAVH